MMDSGPGSTPWTSNAVCPTASARASTSTCRWRPAPMVDVWSRPFHARRPACGECRLRTASIDKSGPRQSRSRRHGGLSPRGGRVHHLSCAESRNRWPRETRGPRSIDGAVEWRRGRVVSADPPSRPTVDASRSWCRDVGRTQLYVMNADGTGARRIAEELDVRGAPAWSPDGQWLAVAANRDGKPQLFKIPVGGGHSDSAREGVLDRSDLGSERTVSRLFRRGRGDEFPVRAVSADGAPADFPTLILTRGARRLAFLGGG